MNINSQKTWINLAKGTLRYTVLMSITIPQLNSGKIDKRHAFCAFFVVKHFPWYSTLPQMTVETLNSAYIKPFCTFSSRSFFFLLRLLLLLYDSCQKDNFPLRQRKNHISGSVRFPSCFYTRVGYNDTILS